MDVLSLAIVKNLDFIERKKINKTDIIICPEYSINTMATDIKFLREFYKNVLFISEKVNYEDNTFIIKSFNIIKLSMDNLVLKIPIQEKNQTTIAIVNTQNFEAQPLVLKSILCAFAFLTKCYIIGIDENYMTYVFDPDGFVLFADNIYTYKTFYFEDITHDPVDKTKP